MHVCESVGSTNQKRVRFLCLLTHWNICFLFQLWGYLQQSKISKRVVLKHQQNAESSTLFARLVYHLITFYIWLKQEDAFKSQRWTFSVGNQVAFVKSKSLCHLKESSFSQYHKIFWVSWAEEIPIESSITIWECNYEHLFDRASFTKFYNWAISFVSL